MLFERLAAAYVRGSLELAGPPLDELSPEELEAVIELGLEAGLRLHRFKRTMDLPRVRKTLGILQGILPESLLDLGTGRGAFLWPLLDRFPSLQVTAADRLDYRVADLEAVRRGGIDNLHALLGTIEELDLPPESFDVVTMLEVLEHTADPRLALRTACGWARRFLILSVPSKADDNPEHLHLLRASQLSDWLTEAGMSRVQLDGVLNHLVVVASRT